MLNSFISSWAIYGLDLGSPDYESVVKHLFNVGVRNALIFEEILQTLIHVGGYTFSLLDLWRKRRKKILSS